VTLPNILNSESLCISPKDINTKKHFFGAFGNIETEVSANYIVRLCQEKGIGPHSHQYKSKIYTIRQDIPDTHLINLYLNNG